MRISVPVVLALAAEAKNTATRAMRRPLDALIVVTAAYTGMRAATRT
jgi:hypothetical protein